MILGFDPAAVVTKTNWGGCIGPHQVYLTMGRDLTFHPCRPIAGVYYQTSKSFAAQIFDVAHRGRKNA